MVRGFEVVENFGTSRLVYLARRQSSRRTAQQLALHVWAFRLEARPEDESVLLPLLLSGAAGLELAESGGGESRSEEHTSELQSPYDLVCRLLLEKKKDIKS